MGIQAENVGEVLIRHINFKTIRVTGDFYGYAPIQVDGKWVIKESARLPSNNDVTL